MAEENPQVTILSEYFTPEEASTAQLVTDLATGLTDRFAVGVLTGRPSYHSADRSRGVPRRESLAGVDVRRLRATRFDKDRLPLRLLNWFTFTLLATVSVLVRRRGDDVRLVLSNPPVLPLATWLAKRIQGVPYVYVVYDVYPEMPIELGYVDEGGLVARLWHRLARAFYRDADRIVVLGDSMERHLTEKLADDPKFDADKIEVIPNWEDPDFIQPMDKADNGFANEQGTVEPFTLVYSGNIGRFHELETAVDAIERLEARGRDDVQLLVIGEGARKAALEDDVAERGIENVRFLPFQPLERLPETLTCGDASLVGIKPEMEGLCVSSKLYSSLAAGRPVLAVVAEGDEVARVVSACDCGAWVEPGDASAAADVLGEWADDPERAESLGANARRCLVERYSLDRAVSAYTDIVSSVVGSAG